MHKNASVYRIDERVLWFMIVVIVISSLILGFRFRNVEPCSDVNIVVRATNYYTGSLVSFRAEAEGGRTYDWEFSDGTKPEHNLNSIQHSFSAPGTYMISVVVNGHCEGFDTVIIQEVPVVKTISLHPEFLAPDSAIVNKPVTFIDTTTDAKSWEWRFGESDIVDGMSQKVSCTYRTPGPKTIYLKINGRSDRVSTRTIYVKDAQPLVQVDNTIKPIKRAQVNSNLQIPDAPKSTGLGQKPAEGNIAPLEEKPKIYADVQADEMIILIQAVVSGEKKPADFSQYFCDDLNIPVTYNGKPMKFSQMCNLLKDFKKAGNISKPEVQLIKNSSTNCIKMMIVNVKKRSRIDRILGKQK